MSNSLGLFQKMGAVIDRWRLPILIFMSSFGLLFELDLVYGALDSRHTVWARILFAVLALLIMLATWFGISGTPKLEQRNAELEDDSKRLQAVIESFGSDYFELWKNKLRIIAGELEFGGGDRVSVYRYDNGKFTMVGRYCEHPKFASPGRTIYPADQGVIGRAWAAPEGFAAVSDLPDAQLDPTNYRERNSKDYRLPLGVIDGLRMKSRSVVAHVLKHSATAERNAIIVFESVTADRFDDLRLRNICTGGWGQEASQFLEALRAREPEIGFAKTRGF